MDIYAHPRYRIEREPGLVLRKLRVLLPDGETLLRGDHSPGMMGELITMVHAHDPPADAMRIQGSGGFVLRFAYQVHDRHGNFTVPKARSWAGSSSSAVPGASAWKRAARRCVSRPTAPSRG